MVLRGDRFSEMRNEGEERLTTGPARLAAAGLVPLLLLGCAAPGPHAGARVAIDREVLLTGPPELAAPEPEVDFLALDDEMRAYLAERVPANAPDLQKTKMLLKQFAADGGIRIRYDSVRTSTAIETFHAREGNCLSFTSLFIAMAREAGLPAFFQEVELPASWDRRGQLYIYRRHINVLLKQRHSDDLIVDFGMADFKDKYPRKRISDEAALAQYHNNMGVHWLLQEDARAALAHQRLALKLVPGADYMWTNLGAVYSHFGYPDYAEAAFRVALSYDKDDLLAISNLVRLYEERGETELAAYYGQQAESLRRENPFYLYADAEQHYADGEYLEAREALRRAIRRQKGEHEFHRLLGLTELSLGEPGLARRHFQLALEYAREPEDQARYHQQLELLAGIGSK
jgi:tetratricopeptide (TPR) repeat protein